MGWQEGHWETPSLAMQSVVLGMIHMHLQLVLEKRVGQWPHAGRRYDGRDVAPVIRWHAEQCGDHVRSPAWKSAGYMQLWPADSAESEQVVSQRGRKFRLSEDSESGRRYCCADAPR